MIKYTQEDFDNFPIDAFGYKTCPSGDYTAIKESGEKCNFAGICVFGDNCNFGAWCSFGERCIFCQDCSFGQCCKFGEHCFFSDNCDFGKYCDFGGWCSFSECCNFGVNCSFGDNTFFNMGCKIEGGRKFRDHLKFEGFGSIKRCTYFWLLTDGTIYVRCGCFAGDIDEFKQKVKETHGNNKYAQGYIKVADLVEWKFYRSE